MAFFNPFSWGGGPDEVNWDRLRGLASEVRGQYGKYEANTNAINFGVTPEDQAQYDLSYGHMRDLVMQDLQTKLPGLLQDVSGQAGARGLSGSAVEQGLRQRAGLAAQRQAGSILSEYGSQQAGLMQQGALQRGQLQLTRNQQLWQNLMQSYSPSFGVESSFLDSEQQRIAGERSAFGQLLGGAAGWVAGGPAGAAAQKKIGGWLT